jgi:hypothetical protein
MLSKRLGKGCSNKIKELFVLPMPGISNSAGSIFVLRVLLLICLEKYFRESRNNNNNKKRLTEKNFFFN